MPDRLVRGRQEAPLGEREREKETMAKARVCHRRRHQRVLSLTYTQHANIKHAMCVPRPQSLPLLISSSSSSLSLSHSMPDPRGACWMFWGERPRPGRYHLLHKERSLIISLSLDLWILHARIDPPQPNRRGRVSNDAVSKWSLSWHPEESVLLLGFLPSFGHQYVERASACTYTHVTR